MCGSSVSESARDRPRSVSAQARIELEERAVGAVDVVPERFGGAHVGDLVERIDRAGIGRAGARDDREGHQAGGAIGLHRVAQPLERQPVAPVAGDPAHPVGHDAGHLGRLEHRVMGLIRRVEHAAADVGAEVAFAGAQDGVEGGHRATGGEQSARRGRKAHPVAQPVERVGFELHQRRRRHPHAGEAVHGVGDEIGERRGIQPATGNERQIPARRGVERRRHAAIEHHVEQRSERTALLRRRLAQCATERLGPLDVAANRLLGQAGDELDAASGHLVGHGAHLVGRELERHAR